MMQQLEDSSLGLGCPNRQYPDTNVNYGWMTEWANMCQEKPGLETAERLEAIAAVDPDNYVAYVCRGVALLIRTSFEEAASELNRAIPLDPDSQDIFFWKGMVHAYLGQDDEAIAAIEKSLELDLPPILLSPLRWIEQDRSAFYQKYAAPLLARLEV
jgi:tetratricopeptide (TPR) repeat protein